MKFNSQQATRALILISFSIFLFNLHYTGEINKFINPKYDHLSQSAAIIFLLLFLIQITRVWSSAPVHTYSDCKKSQCCSLGHTHEHGDTPFTTKKLISCAMIVFPLLTGFLLPAKVLDASIANKKGAMITLSGSGNPDSENGEDSRLHNKHINKGTATGEQNVEEPGDDLTTGSENEMRSEEYDKLMMALENSEVIKLNDRIYSSFFEEISTDVNKYKGRKIELTGFVYKEEGFNGNQLVISRFLITHCVADAGIIGFLSEFRDASRLKKDSWINAEGIIGVTTYKGALLPYIKVTNWQEIAEPKKPYLYPITIRHS
ncbi:TIGR03943 family putative permease subunit [Mesobacillus foraminis]|uniref:Putative membrane protein n=1 Tax=Mesobacillus foraminis TaxID=279826 RepID=A0A4V2RDI6_9BACI|nr:TIGR03943 family protein [Mesobacillus foraminis]TCN24990.1 putative membrane protein [Mesobacillus foraminis]